MTEASELIEMILVEHQHAEEKELRLIRHSLLVLIGMLAVVAIIVSFNFYLNVTNQTDREQEHTDLQAAVCGTYTEMSIPLPPTCTTLGEP